MKLNWFTRKGIVFIPSSFTGGLIFLFALSYAVYSFIEIDHKSHSVSDTLMNFVFRLFIIWVIYTLIALVSMVNSDKDRHIFKL